MARPKCLSYGAAVLRRSGPLTALLLACALSASSALASPSAFSGSISTPQVGPGGGSVSAQISVTGTCDGTYCGFFPVVTTVSAAQACTDAITGSTWVGTLQSPPFGSMPPSVTDAELATWSEWPSLFSGAKHACLYAETGSGLPVLVAQADYVVPAPAPVPVYTPPSYTPPATTTPPPPVPAITPTTTVPQSLSRSEAISVMRGWLKRRYGQRWTGGRSRIVKCPVRSSDAQLGCYAVWLYGHRVLSRSEVITETEDSYIFSKDFLSAPPQDTDAGDVPAATGDDFCATHVCIPNYENGTGTTVQCADGTYSHSGGKQGACSHHGGVGHDVRRVAARVARVTLSDRLASALAAVARLTP